MASMPDSDPKPPKVAPQYTLTWYERGIHPYDYYTLSPDKLRSVSPYHWWIIWGYYQWGAYPIIVEHDTLKGVIASIEAIERACRDAGVYEISRYMEGEMPALLIRSTVPGAWWAKGQQDAQSASANQINPESASSL